MLINEILVFLSVFSVEVSVVNYYLAVQLLNVYLVDGEILVTILNLCNFNALACHCLCAELLLPPDLSYCCFVYLFAKLRQKFQMCKPLHTFSCFLCIFLHFLNNLRGILGHKVTKYKGQSGFLRSVGAQASRARRFLVVF